MKRLYFQTKFQEKNKLTWPCNSSLIHSAHIEISIQACLSDNDDDDGFEYHPQLKETIFCMNIKQDLTPNEVEVWLEDLPKCVCNIEKYNDVGLTFTHSITKL